MTEPFKKLATIGCCGIDCGLCPRYHTKGESACPGCGGHEFTKKHPSCGFLTCCAIKHGWEVCADCNQYPCKRFEAEKNGYDSFVTHKKVFMNLAEIKNKGILQFIENQRKRMEILIDLLTYFDDGRSKNFFCISCALLPLSHLLDLHRFAFGLDTAGGTNEKNKCIKIAFTDVAKNLNIELKLNKYKDLSALNSR